MRIGLVSTYPPIECGIATYTCYLNNALNKKGNETFVISQIGAQGERVFPVYGTNDTSLASSIYNASANLTPDIIHIQHEFGLYGDQNGVQIIELILRYKLSGIHVVVTFHTVHNKNNPRTDLIQRLILSECSAVIVHEEILKKILVRRFGMEEKIHVIPHGVRDVSLIPDAKKKLDLEGKKVILLCGYFRPTKGFYKIIDIMPKICRQMDDAVLLLAGKSRRLEYIEYRTMLFERVNKSPVNDKIVILRGQFPQYTFDTIISACDVTVLPYQIGAQSGIMAQCYAFHKPIVTSNLPAFKRSIKASQGGLACNNREDYVKNIIKILKDDEYRHKLENNIEKYVNHQVGWSKTAEKHVEVYHSVVNVPYGKAKYAYFTKE